MWWEVSRTGFCEQLTMDLESLSRLLKVSVSPSGEWGECHQQDSLRGLFRGRNLLRLSLLLTDLLTHSKALCHLY